MGQDGSPDELFDLLIDLHLPHERQGPGSTEATMLAWEMAGLDRSTRYRVLDIGSGTGASALTIVTISASVVTAVDLPAPFLVGWIDSPFRGLAGCMT